MTPATPPASLAPPMLQARGLVKHYDGRKVLDGIDLDIAPGETVAITGANGSGKSTLLRLLACAARPDAGTLHIGGQASHDNAARARMSWLAQDPALYDELTLQEHVTWWSRVTGRAPDPTLLRDAGLAALAHRRAGALSRGQRQRAALSLALLGDPDLLLLDEPFTGLDAAGQEWLRTRLQQRRGRRATVLVLHGDEQARQLADRIVRLHRRRAEAA